MASVAWHKPGVAIVAMIAEAPAGSWALMSALWRIGVVATKRHHQRSRAQACGCAFKMRTWYQCRRVIERMASAMLRGHRIDVYSSIDDDICVWPSLIASCFALMEISASAARQ